MKKTIIKMPADEPGDKKVEHSCANTGNPIIIKPCQHRPNRQINTTDTKVHF